MINATEYKPVVQMSSIENIFPIVAASQLTLNDEILKHKPKTREQCIFKKRLIEVIKSGLSDFRVQKFDPCFDDEEHICYKADMEPAIGKSAAWWKHYAKMVLPEKNSRLGRFDNYIAFLGVLLKALVSELGFSMDDAWESVCDNSCPLGHYYDSENSIHSIENTKKRLIALWFDLANTRKFVIHNDDYTFFRVGGCYYTYGKESPLANFEGIYKPSFGYADTVGWITCDV